LNNTVDTKIFFPENRSSKNNQIKKLIHVSCFDDEPKNITGLVDCIKELSTQRDDFTVDMVGTGLHFDKIVQQTKDLGLYGSKIFFTGQLEGLELADKMRSAHILMLFSNYENMPVVINESFCCGVPVISTNVGGIEEFIHAKNGKLVPKGDKKLFVKELNYMMDHLNEYSQTTISEEAKNMFSISAVADKLDEIYTKSTYPS
jgi:glycosyltransferase involved in cell wall biosynthesis